MTTLLQDLKYAVRTLAKSPGFTLVAVLTLGLGIGANTAIFSVVDALLMRPLPYPHQERLVLVEDEQPGYGRAPASWLEFQDWKKASSSFEKLTARTRRDMNLSGDGPPERVRVGLAAEDFFDVTGATTEVGRVFSAEEQAVGGGSVALISHGLWMSRFGADRSIVGRRILLDDVPFQVVGVLSPRSIDLSAGVAASVWIPLESNAPWRNRGNHYLTVIGRLRPGTTLETARAESAALAKSLDSENRNHHGIFLSPLREAFVGNARPRLLALLGAVGFVLLIATANVSSLALSRALGRAREFAVRHALGATRGRLSRQILTESALVGAVGGLAGIGIGDRALSLILAAWPPGTPRPVDVGFDWRLAAFAAAISIGAGIAFGLAPALLGGSHATASSLKEGAGAIGPTHAGRRVRLSLVAGQLALCLVLLVGAGLLLTSLSRALATDPGFRADHVLCFELNLPGARYPEEARRDLFARLAERLSAVPGVQAVAAANNIPLASSMSGDFRIEGRPPFPVAETPAAEKRIVTPDYFRAMGIPTVAGRTFSEADGEGAKVAVINRSMARKFWPNESPIGKRIQALACGDCWEEIVGVVGDVKVNGLDQPGGFEIAVPFRELPLSEMVVIVRTAGDPAALAGTARQVVGELDPAQPVSAVRTMESEVGSSLADRRLSTQMLAAASLLALALALVGVAGLVSYGVSRRTREIGVRVALGATSRDILVRLLAETLVLVGAGVGIGLPASLALNRALRSQLFEVSPHDPVVLLAATVTLAAAALAASCLPARRALRIDPARALRNE